MATAKDRQEPQKPEEASSECRPSPCHQATEEAAGRSLWRESGFGARLGRPLTIWGRGRGRAGDVEPTPHTLQLLSDFAASPGQLCSCLEISGKISGDSKVPQGHRPRGQPLERSYNKRPALKPWAVSVSQGSQILNGGGSVGAGGHAHS